MIIGALLILVAPAEAKRVQHSMGQYVREAGLIVIADTGRSGHPGYETILKITDVIKGDSAAKGTTLVLDPTRSSADVHVPAPMSGLILLLHPMWASREECRQPVLEIYNDAEELVAIRRLVEIYRLPDERSQLSALRDEALTGSDHLKNQFFSDLKNMQDSANFDMMVGLFDSLGAKDHVKLIQLVADTGDSRAVPVLIKAMESPAKEVRSAAQGKLISYYPGAPGVTEAIERAFVRDPQDVAAARYLLLRRNDPAVEQTLKKSDTPFIAAERLRAAGETTSARAVCLAILEDEEESTYTRRHCTVRLVDDADEKEKERIRKAMLPLLTADVGQGNYLEAREAVHVLRKLRHPDCLEPLLTMLPRTDSLNAAAARTATMAVRELGTEARRQGAARLIDGFTDMEKKLRPGLEDELPYLMQILWLADTDGLTRADAAMPASCRKSWNALNPLRTLPETQDEGAFLISLYGGSIELPLKTRAWLLYRLGDLRDQRAVELLARHSNIGCYTEVHRELANALVAIGGPQVEREMSALLTSEDKCVRRLALDTLISIQGERSRELARRMLHDDDSGIKMRSICALEQYGTLDDLELLLPLCNYWRPDRSSHYWAMQAVTAIRTRYKHDLSGPIRTVP